MSVYPGGDPAYPPPSQAMYNNPGMPPPPYQAQAANMNPMGMMGLAPVTENYEWGTFSAGGIDILNDQDKISITKLFNQEEALTFVDKPRRFSVTNEGTKQMFSLIENEETMATPAVYRSFQIDAFDPSGKKAFQIIREETSFCSYCCFCCACFGNGCRTKVKVKVDDRTIGSVNQDCSFSVPRFTIYRGGDYDGDELLKVEGASACCTPATTYGLRYPKDSTPSGQLKKLGPAFGGLSNNYNINFPEQSNAELKTLCIAAIVLFDFRFFNRPVPQNRRRR